MLEYKVQQVLKVTQEHQELQDSEVTSDLVAR